MSPNRKWRAAIILAAACLAASAWALKTDKDQPINIQADHGDFRSNSQTGLDTGVYTGHVVITQGSIRITADRAVVQTRNSSLQNADATGHPATFEQQPDTGALIRGSAAEVSYDAGKNTVVLSGNARIVQGARLLSAEVIRYNTETEHVLASGGKTGERVHITIPPKRNAAGNPPP